MKFPNLSWAMKRARLANYQLAAILEMSESRVSRSLNGLLKFTPQEKKKICKVLGYSKAWLFQEIEPPRASAEARPVAARA